MIAAVPFNRRLKPVTASACALALALTTGAGLHASDQAVVLTRFQAVVQPATSLRISSHFLVIDASTDGFEGPVEVGFIEFRAAARTARNGEVVLTVEPMSTLDAFGSGAAGPPPAVSFLGSGDGAQNGVLRAGQPEAAARWVGSGLHAGRVTFVVRGSVGPQGASVPLRFLLAVP